MEKLIKMLKLIGGSYSTDNYHLGWKVFDVVKENPDSVVSFENKMDWRRYSPHMEEHWITYQNARNLKFYLKGKTLFVEVVVADLGLMGDRYEPLWSAVIKLPSDFLKNIETELRKKFYHFCDVAYEDYLLSMREEWIRRYAEKILV